MSSACDGMLIKIVNSGVTYTDGEGASITITGAGASKEGGSLTDASGNSPPAVPISVAYEGSVTLTAQSGKGSEGQAEGTITIQCVYAVSATQGSGTKETITCNYAGHPVTIFHDTHCTPSGTGGTSAHFQVQATNSEQASGGSCWVELQVMNGGSGQSS